MREAAHDQGLTVGGPGDDGPGNAAWQEAQAALAAVQAAEMRSRRN